jgi:hypothetical protein
MAAIRIAEVPASPTNRHDRAALGVIATYLHELTEHGRPREDDAVTAFTLDSADDELAGCYACA